MRLEIGAAVFISQNLPLVSPLINPPTIPHYRSAKQVGGSPPPARPSGSVLLGILHVQTMRHSYKQKEIGFLANRFPD